jgi:hypothetical protein
MTLSEHLRTLPADYTNPAGPRLGVKESVYSDKEVSQQNGLPYVRIELQDGNLTKQTYNHTAFISKLVDVYLYQQPLNGRPQPKDKAYAIFWEILQARKVVDAMPYGQPFAKPLMYEAEAEPDWDEKHVLFGFVRFRALLRR